MSDPIELLENRISEFLEGHVASSGLHFFCQVGGRYDDQGITTLQISGSGWALLSWRLDDETLMYSYQLQTTDLKKIYSMLLQHPFWRAAPKRRSQADGEVNYHLRVSDQKKGTSNGLQFWTSDVEEFPVLGELLTRLSSLVQVLSEGEIEEIPR